MHRYDNYRWLRGFNLIPSWGARIEQAWWDYDAGRFREEVALAKTVHDECARWTIRMMEDAGYGWMGWGMREGKAISTRRDRYDGNGLDGQGFHAWFNADGSLRAGLDFLHEPPGHPAPWTVVGKDEAQP